MNKDVLKKISEEFSTPAFIFDTDEFSHQAEKIKKALGSVPLCFSIKANPFLLAALPDSLTHVEVCSPGELTICQRLKIDPSMIIYSGVNKGVEDVARAIEYGVGTVTAESPLHLQLFNDEALRTGTKVRILLRLSSGNQFGMDEKTLADIISRRDEFTGLEIIGFHYYSGTQKKKVSMIEKDIEAFEGVIERQKEKYGFCPELVEYGPGMSAEYFNPPYVEKDDAELDEVCVIIRKFAKKYNVSIEMGRFLASSCGAYITSVADVKNTDGTNYVICDGGINQLKYYGQTMAMQVPPITALYDSLESDDYTLCGSLCTTADILVRKVTLPKLSIGDVLAFSRCGAYTVTEGIGLFLSRALPAIILYSRDRGATLVRDFYNTDVLNTPETES